MGPGVRCHMEVNTGHRHHTLPLIPDRGGQLNDNKNNKYHFLDEQKFKTDLINILGNCPEAPH